MWRRLRAIALTLFLTTVPATAMALGSDKEEPNWKLWALATLGCFLIVGPLAATGLYAWWMRRMRAGAARTWSYLMMFFIPAALSMGAYLWFVGAIPDLVVWVALAVLVVMLIVASVGSRRRAF
jgi:hypothetical protein